MSLNCLNCQVLKRTDSDGREMDFRAENYSYEKLLRSKQAQQRSWSGNLAPMVAPPPVNGNYAEQTKSGLVVVAHKKVSKSGHRRLNSAGALGFEGTAEPRLLRSSGMRRDWSFENLRERDDKKHYLSGRIC